MGQRIRVESTIGRRNKAGKNSKTIKSPMTRVWGMTKRLKHNEEDRGLQIGRA